MVERILVATDFSTRSDRLLLRAKLIAHKTGAKLTLAHVVDDDQPDRLLAPAVTEANSLLREIAATLSNQDSIAAEPLVKAAEVSAGILSAAEEAAADLIMVGSPRNRALGTFPGRTVERVVHSTTTPLLIAVAPPVGPYGGSLLAMDFDEASKAAARAALALGIFDHMQVTVMHAVDAPAEGMLQRSMVGSDEVASYRAAERQAADARLAEHLADLDLPSTSSRAVAMIGSPARTILETARAEKAALVILGTSQRKGFARVLIGSVAADVIRESERDLLIVPVD